MYVDDAGYWNSERFEQEVEWLTTEQVALLETMEFVFLQAEPCRLLADGSIVTVTVTDDDGSVRTGRSTTNLSEDEWQVTGILAFLNTFECRGGIYLNARPLEEPLEAAPVFPPNDGCHHRFAGEGWFATEVATAGTYRLVLSGVCDETSSIRLHAPTIPVAAVDTFGPDAGSSVLGESAAVEDGACPTLVVELAEPGLYPVYVIGGNDTYLRVTKE